MPLNSPCLNLMMILQEAQFVSIIEPFLRDVRSRRGIIDFKVVCDGTNNPSVIDEMNSEVISLLSLIDRLISSVSTLLQLHLVWNFPVVNAI